MTKRAARRSRTTRVPPGVRWFHSILDWLAPRECAACRTAARSGFCADCRAAIVPPGPRAIDGVPVFASGVYRAPLDRAIARFKYESCPELSGPLAALVPVPTIDFTRALVVPVPLHPLRLVERGYNQSALLGAKLAARLRVGHAPLALRRIVATDRQAELGRHERLQNVAGAFVARSRARLAGRSVVLVDDVVTTGATALGCIQALRLSGARPIGVWCIAMTGNTA